VEDFKGRKIQREGKRTNGIFERSHRSYAPGPALFLAAQRRFIRHFSALFECLKSIRTLNPLKYTKSIEILSLFKYPKPS
jgi:hypothetical protein